MKKRAFCKGKFWDEKYNEKLSRKLQKNFLKWKTPEKKFGMNNRGMQLKTNA
jgi:hypothetical protein